MSFNHTVNRAYQGTTAARGRPRDFYVVSHEMPLESTCRRRLTHMIGVKNGVVNKAALLLLSWLTVSCANWGAREWVGSDVAGFGSGAATSIEWSSLPVVITCIDGKAVGTGYKQAMLSPGRHVIEYAYYTAEFGRNPQGTVEIDLVRNNIFIRSLGPEFSWHITPSGK